MMTSRPAFAHLDSAQTYYAFTAALQPNDDLIIEGRNGPRSQRIQIQMLSSTGEEIHLLDQNVVAAQPFLVRWKNSTGRVQPYFLVGFGVAAVDKVQWTVMLQHNRSVSAVMDYRAFTGTAHAGHEEAPGHEPLSITDFRSFPNPVRGKAQIGYAVTGDVSKLIIQIWAPSGQLVKGIDVTNIAPTGRGFIELDVSDLDTGVYLMRMLAEGNGKAQRQFPLAVVGE